MPSIGDIVKANPDAEFASDVQLQWYPDDKRNVRLAKGYIFTSRATQNHVASVEIVERLQKALTWEGEPNRFVVIATYGHGKSHLALALANYFGMPEGSDVVTRILNNIAHAVDQPAEAQKFRDFKANHAPYLVVRLHGAEMKSLHQQLISGLETALKECPQTSDASLPFWFNAAESFLQGLDGEQLEKANDYLDGHGTEVNILLRRVRDRDTTARELCRQVFSHLFGTPPDFGGDKAPREVVEWAADEFCGEGKPFPGMVILFDEFSAFIRNYATGAVVHADGVLQGLLDGVANRKGKVAFAAFSQHDPDTVADSAGTGKEQRESLKKELTRLESKQRYLLHSSMETVIDSYLKQDDAQWEQMLSGPAVQSMFVEADSVTMQLFEARYDLRVGWGEERVREVLTKGCFPMHPLTTALLCSVQLNDVAHPRPVLGFLLDELKSKQEQPALIQEKPNWICATRLVDEFGNMLGDVAYREFEYAMRQVGVDAPETHLAVLKAMLLHTAAALPHRRPPFTRAISALTGYTVSECEQALEELHAGGHIRKDLSKDVFGFYPEGGGGARVEGYIRDEADTTKLDLDDINEHKGKWGDRLGKISVSADYGHAEDWAAEQYLLTRESFTVSGLRKLIQTRRVGRNGLEDAPRGFVLWLLPESDEDVEWLRSNAESVLDEALGETPPPVVVGIPRGHHQPLWGGILREQVVLGIPAEKRREFGEMACEDAKKRLVQSVDEGLTELQSDCAFHVPRDYRAAVQSIAALAGLEGILKQSYALAYTAAPPFFTQYKATNAQLRKGVQVVSGYLGRNQPQHLDKLRGATPVGDDIQEKYLRVGGEMSWGILTLDYKLQRPARQRVQKAWDVLDQSFTPERGEVKVAPVLLKLMNPPYGFDYNQLTLLFCAWFGHNQRDLQLTLNGKFARFDDIAGALEKPHDLINALCYVMQACVLRREQGALRKDIEQIIKDVAEGGFSPEQAEGAVAKLSEFVDEDNDDPGLKQAAESAIQRLKDARTKAAEYDRKAADILSHLENATTVRGIGECLKQIGLLPRTDCVSHSQPGPDKISERADLRMTTVLHNRCRSLERLDKLTDFGLKHQQLMEIRAELTAARMSQLHSLVDSAIAKLEAARAELESRGQDEPALAAMDQMKTTAPLAHLRESFSALNGYQLHSEEASSRANQLKQDLSRAIQASEKWVADFTGRVAAVDSQAVRGLYNEGQKRLESYDGTAEYEALSAMLTKCEKLQSFFDEIREVRATQLSLPDDVERALGRLDGLKANAEAGLSGPQLKTLEDARGFIQRAAEAKAAQANNWLEDLERAARERRSLRQALDQLGNPPAFLPESGGQRARELRREIERTLQEDDALRIRELFAGIGDKARQRKLLEELRVLVDQGDAE